MKLFILICLTKGGYDFLFGTSLENCLLRDKKRQATTVGSKHSLRSLFLSNDNSDSREVGKLHNNVSIKYYSK